MKINDKVRKLYSEFGQQKPMGLSVQDSKRPHYFLLRTFFNENDLLIILNTKRCAYQCHFCQLPAKSSKLWIPAESIIAQFEYVFEEMKHALSVLDRVTLSNEGSVLDTDTMPTNALIVFVKCIHELRRVRTLTLETRLEYLDSSILRQIKENAPKISVNILTGFETYDPHVRDKVLFKRESLEQFEIGLDKVAENEADLTTYVLFKPSPVMSDFEAFVEAERSIDYLVEECKQRGIALSIRLNPMYMAKGSRWSKIAEETPDYRPPRLTDVMRLAEKKTQEGIKIYIGLSTEGLDGGGGYLVREDYAPSLIKPIKLFNDGKIKTFGLDEPHNI